MGDVVWTDEAREAVARAMYEEFFPDGDWELLMQTPHRDRMLARGGHTLAALAPHVEAMLREERDRAYDAGWSVGYSLAEEVRRGE